jgi:hypothetical protein
MRCANSASEVEELAGTDGEADMYESGFSRGSATTGAFELLKLCRFAEDPSGRVEVATVMFGGRRLCDGDSPGDSPEAPSDSGGEGEGERDGGVSDGGEDVGKNCSLMGPSIWVVKMGYRWLRALEERKGKLEES